MYLMDGYDTALQEILESGVSRTNQRTKIKTLSVFGMLKRYKLNTEYFPILSRRKVWPKSVFAELLWFLSGSTRNEDLQKLGCNFWTPWVNEEFERQHGFDAGVFGPVYGFQLRHFGGHYNNGIHDGFDYGFGGFDQLVWVVNRIKEDPSCRRILWTLWNPNDVSAMRLPPCHMLFQVLIDDDRRMTGMMYQRSCDFPVGVPANIQFYSALTVMLAQQTDCTPWEFVHVTADSHIYGDQIEAVKEYLATPVVDSPKLKIHQAPDIFSYKLEDFEISDYNPGKTITIPVAV